MLDEGLLDNLIDKKKFLDRLEGDNHMPGVITVMHMDIKTLSREIMAVRNENNMLLYQLKETEIALVHLLKAIQEQTYNSNITSAIDTMRPTASKYGLSI